MLYHTRRTLVDWLRDKVSTQHGIHGFSFYYFPFMNDRIAQQDLPSPSVVLSMALVFRGQGWSFYGSQGWTRPQGRPPDSILFLIKLSIVLRLALAFIGQGFTRSVYFMQGWARPPGRPPDAVQVLSGRILVQG